MDLAERFVANVEQVGTCLIWTGRKHEVGYGVLAVRPKVYAHRWALEQVEGPLPEDYDVHHICHVKPCVNHIHLLAVPKDEHWMYEPVSLVCSEGHWLSPDAVYVWHQADGRVQRACKRCVLERSRARRETDAAAKGRALAVPNSEKSSCPRGHAYDAENTGRRCTGQRYCKTCNRERANANHARRRTAAAASQAAPTEQKKEQL